MSDTLRACRGSGLSRTTQPLRLLPAVAVSTSTGRLGDDAHLLPSVTVSDVPASLDRTCRRPLPFKLSSGRGFPLDRGTAADGPTEIFRRAQPCCQGRSAVAS